MNKKKSTILTIIFSVITTLVVVLVVQAGLGDSEASADGAPKFIVEADGLTDEQIHYVEHNIIPTASDVFEYEEVKVYETSNNDAYYLNLIATNESVGKAYSTYIEKTWDRLATPDKEEAIVEIASDMVQGVADASMELSEMVNKSVEITLQTPEMENYVFMKVRDGEIMVFSFLPE